MQQFSPLVLDGMVLDKPYCGVCGRNVDEDAVKATRAEAEKAKVKRIERIKVRLDGR